MNKIIIGKFTKIFLGIIAVSTILICQPLEGQVVFGQPPTGEIKFIFQNWTLDDAEGEKTKLSQWVVPISAYIPISDNWELTMTSSTAGSSVDPGGGSESSLSGLNDTRLMAYRSFMDDRILLGAGINLPTGKKALDSSEVGVIGLLTESFLNMPIKNYGEGFGLNLEGGYVYNLDIYTFGAGLGYIIKGSFEPLEGTADYKPGNHLRLGAFASLRKDRFRGTISLVYNLFARDKLGDTPVFKDGNMVDIWLNVGYTKDNISTNVGLREIIRGKDERMISGVLEVEEAKSHGAETRFFGQIAYALNEKYSLKALLDYKYVAANGYDDSKIRYFGSSNYFGIGLGGNAVFTEIFKGFAELEYFTGSADDGDVDMSGWEVVIGMGATF